MGTLVNDGATAWQAWPKAAVSEFMITKSAKPDALEDVNGAMTRVAFMRGEPIRHDKLVKAGAGGFMSAILPTGKRAVAIKIDNGGDSSAGGFILPNDRVDVVRLARDEDATKARGVEVMTAQTILANVRVLAIGQNVEELERQESHHRSQRDARTRSGSGQPDHSRSAGRQFASSSRAPQPRRQRRPGPDRRRLGWRREGGSDRRPLRRGAAGRPVSRSLFVACCPQTEPGS
jgi:Flp pilus assembly protein CpaB